MRRLLPVVLALTGLLVPTFAVAGEPVIVVLNQRNPTQNIDKAQLKSIYLGNTAFWHGVVPMKVYTQPADSDATKTFLDDILGITFQRYQQSWASRELSGQGVAPAVVDDAQSVIDSVRGAPGGIGFLTPSSAWTVAPEGVKFLEVQP